MEIKRRSSLRQILLKKDLGCLMETPKRYGTQWHLVLEMWVKVLGETKGGPIQTKKTHGGGMMKFKMFLQKKTVSLRHMTNEWTY